MLGIVRTRPNFVSFLVLNLGVEFVVVVVHVALLVFVEAEIFEGQALPPGLCGAFVVYHVVLQDVGQASVRILL